MTKKPRNKHSQSCVSYSPEPGRRTAKQPALYCHLYSEIISVLCNSEGGWEGVPKCISTPYPLIAGRGGGGAFILPHFTCPFWGKARVFEEGLSAEKRFFGVWRTQSLLSALFRLSSQSWGETNYPVFAVDLGDESIGLSSWTRLTPLKRREEKYYITRARLWKKRDGCASFSLCCCVCSLKVRVVCRCNRVI